MYLFITQAIIQAIMHLPICDLFLTFLNVCSVACGWDRDQVFGNAQHPLLKLYVLLQKQFTSLLFIHPGTEINVLNKY